MNRKFITKKSKKKKNELKLKLLFDLNTCIESFVLFSLSFSSFVHFLCCFLKVAFYYYLLFFFILVIVDRLLLLVSYNQLTNNISECEIEERKKEKE